MHQRMLMQESLIKLDKINNKMKEKLANGVLCMLFSVVRINLVEITIFSKFRQQL